MANSIDTGNYRIAVDGVSEGVKVALSVETQVRGLEHVHIRVESDQPTVFPQVTLSWRQPMALTHQIWHPACGNRRNIGPDWSPTGVESECARNAPVISLSDISGANTLTFAFSDCLNTSHLSAGASEETALLVCRVVLFTKPLPPMTSYEATLRLDARPIPYYQSLREVSRWWAEQPGYAPSEPPDLARLPLYSSWYSFHQTLDPARIETQCRIAKSMGMEAIIVDDGWQTDDASRGYEHCGDWEVTPGKFPDFAAHVARVHEIGMKYVLWFSVPFVGVGTKAYERFKDKLLDADQPRKWYCLDPRFADVRDYLIGIYESFITRYDIDGFKLDFVDAFGGQPDSSGGRDCASVAVAVDRLLTDAMARLRALKPEVLIEFRQSYIGPLMRKYGNMMRAGDVPNDFAGNRLRTIDVRLLSDATPAHADMFMWHPSDPVESAAMQLIHALFAVPQVSVMLDEIPADHRRMVEFLLKFWRENRDVLLDGELMPLSPEMLYPVVMARSESKLLAACYSSSARIRIDDAPGTLIVVNGTMDSEVVMDLKSDAGARTLTVYKCTGEKVLEQAIALRAGLHSLPVPPAGIAYLK